MNRGYVLFDYFVLDYRNGRSYFSELYFQIVIYFVLIDRKLLELKEQVFFCLGWLVCGLYVSVGFSFED